MSEITTMKFLEYSKRFATVQRELWFAWDALPLTIRAGVPTSCLSWREAGDNALFELRFIQTLPQDSNKLCPLKTTAQTLLCPPTSRERCQVPALTFIYQCLILPRALQCRATAALILFLTGRFTSLHHVQFPSARLHTCDCRGSLSQLRMLRGSLQRELGEEGRQKEVERQNRYEHFSGVLSFFIWSARSCWTTNQKCAEEKEKTTKHRQQLCIPASTRKSPILGQSRQLSLAHLLSFECLYLSVDSVGGIHRWDTDGSVLCRLLLLRPPLAMWHPPGKSPKLSRSINI